MDEFYSGETCLIATHIGPGWEAPVEFAENVERLLEEEDYDHFAYVSHRRRHSPVYEEEADEVVRSSGGQVWDVNVDGWLDGFDEFVHIGAYWDVCHRRTWEDLVRGVYRRDEPGEYTVTFPLRQITDDTELATEFIDEGNVDDEVGFYVLPYPDHVQKGVHFDYEFHDGPEPEIRWTLRKTADGGVNDD